jgi:hypothetical protein
MYGDVQVAGSFGLGADMTLRPVAERADAIVGVLASTNAPENISAAAKLLNVLATLRSVYFTYIFDFDGVHELARKIRRFISNDKVRTSSISS